MANTNFALLEDDEKKVWSRQVWKQVREKMFITKFMGTSMESMIYRITELTKTERGAEAIVPLVPDLVEDGVTGDNVLKGNEEAMLTSQEKVEIDQLRHAVANTGRMADQRSVLQWRKLARDRLSFWLADRIDQMAFLTLAGVQYTQTNGNATRGGNLPGLAFAPTADRAPSSERHMRVTGKLLADGDTTAIEATDTLGYDVLVQLQALAKTRYLRGVRGNGGSEKYHLFLHPMALAKLKLDQDFKENARQAGVRGDSNTLWSGGESYVVDGIMIHEFRHVFTTLQAAGGSKWGAGGTVEGCRGLLCGAQALAIADLGAGYWDEEDEDYKNNSGIAFGKMFGMVKPRFKYAKDTADTEIKQDYGVIALDMAI